jgi:hypothetical protein
MRSTRRLLLLPALLPFAAGCTPPKDSDEEDSRPPVDSGDSTDSADSVDSGDTGDPGPAPEWDPDPPALACANTLKAPLLEAALADAGLSRDALGWTEAEYDAASYARYLDDDFLLSWYRGLQRDVSTIPCFAGERTRALEFYGAAGHAATGALWIAMQALDVPRHANPPRPERYPTLASGLDALLTATGDKGLTWDDSRLPDGLGEALGPVLGAMAEVVSTWLAVEAGAPERAARLAPYGHGGVILDYRAYPDLTDRSVREWVLSDAGPRALQAPTLDLAWVVEHAGLDAFAGLGDEGELLRLETSQGLVLVLGPGADAPGELGDVLFLLDLGGDDTWVHAVGANGDGKALSLAIDLGGDDSYGYTPRPDPNDGKRLPSDAAGRYGGDDYYGPFSLSHVGRQGSGRFGVGLLFDLGGGDDLYSTLRMGQGWGHLGVGLLYDDAGNDLYESEAGAQGAASMGIGLLLDGDGDDVHRAYADSQGFAYTQAVGLLWDAGEGRDAYLADPGNPDVGGDPIYYSPQMPGRANSSFCQGVGFGMRNDTDRTFLSGGLGLLRDGGGDDVYVASTFAQGSGYWQGTGILSDAGGNDSFDAYYYVQGGAAHYAIGALLDAAGDDRLNQTLGPTYMQFGAGHDFSVGLYVDEAGDDTYTWAGLAAGASNCQGIGIFVDNAGNDVYNALSTYSTGLGNHSGECATGARSSIHSIGLFLDAGGVETWTWPDAEGRQPADDSSFGIAWSGTADEHGGAVDGEGETAFHASGSPEDIHETSTGAHP